MANKTDLATTVARKLITLRRRRGFDTATEAAAFLGMGTRQYLAYERGDREIRLSTLGRILDGFDATFLELWGLPEGRPNRPGGRPAR